ncbi:MAG: hypothetical protein PHE11_06625 [Candidatus Omnitrophica bacterium]|jgi:hypothetical protein|nr:hypothetical protein [Candidatus Omnitrophota bacterium]
MWLLVDQYVEITCLADEWPAYYQYWVGSKVACGRMRGIIAGVKDIKGSSFYGEGYQDVHIENPAFITRESF